jgi:hypothetical protein
MLDDFVEDMARRPFRDGSADCALTVADWVILATGCADPAADLRGRYRTPLGRERLLRRRGGLLAVITVCAARAGLDETQDPTRGDIGLIEVAGQPLAAICLGLRWAIKSSHGVTVEPAGRVVRAWRVVHG